MNTGETALEPFPQFPQVSPHFPTYFTTDFTTLFSQHFHASTPSFAGLQVEEFLNVIPILVLGLKAINALIEDVVRESDQTARRLG